MFQLKILKGSDGMIAMRVGLSNYNPVKECRGCVLRDENMVNANILSFQLAHLLLTKFPGTWEIDHGELTLNLEGFEKSLSFDLNTGTLAYGTLRTSFLSRYSPETGLKELYDQIIRDFGITTKETNVQPDDIFALLVKLTEIYHARCGLYFRTIKQDDQTQGWEMLLCQEGLKGKIDKDGVVENRFGEKVDIKEWANLRPEKRAAYVFGFNHFCKHYPNPLKK